MSFRTRIGVMLLCGLALAGCAALNQANTEKFAEDNIERLTMLSVGMTKDLVLGTMGIETIHRCVQATGGICQEFETIANPYRRSQSEVNGKLYDVLYYYTNNRIDDRWYYYRALKKRDADIHKSQLTPVVLENGRLIGWGQDFLATVPTNDK
jgi:hypothetical protein